MSDNKEEDTSKQDNNKQVNFKLQDMFDNNNTTNSTQNAFPSGFRNQAAQTTSYNNLPAEIQHLFDMPATDNTYTPNSWPGRSSPLARVQSNPTPQGSPQSQASPSLTTHSSPILPTSTPPPTTVPVPVPVPVATSPSTTVATSPQTNKVATPHLRASPSIQPQLRANQPTSGTASSMTLLDNLTAQLSPDRKERFIELFRQLQSNAVTANQFLAQAKMLLDQQQYQQLENLKNKPATNSAVASPNRTPIQSPHIPQAQHKTISSSQLRAEDAQRAMSGLIRTPQAKRARTSDIPSHPSPQPLPPLYRSNTAPQQPPPPPQTASSSSPSLQLQQPLSQSLPSTPPPSSLSSQPPLPQQQQQQSQSPLPPPPPPQQQQQPMKQHLIQQHVMQPPLPQNAAEDRPNTLEESTTPQITQAFMNTEMLTEIMTRLTSAHHLKLGPDIVALIALATEKRIHQLLVDMTTASKHRVHSQTFTQPPVNPDGHHPFKIVDIQDIKKQLLAIERVEREEERKRKEMLLENERKALLGEEGGEGDDDRPMKKKKKKEMGPGVTARYMSDDVRNKTTNETALMIAGGVMKSWMLTGMNPSTPKDKIVRQTPPTAAEAPQTQSSPPPPSSSLPPGSPGSSGPLHDQPNDDQPRGRGRPRRRKSGSGPELLTKKAKPPNSTPASLPAHRPQPEGGLFLPPSTIGRPHRLGEQGTRKVTVRDALFVLEDEYDNKATKAVRRTLLKAYANYLK